MSRKPYRRRSNINAAVWLIGLGILWLTDLWWPGILILVGISMLVQVMVGQGEREEIGTPVTAPVSPSEPVQEPADHPEPEDELWADEEDTAETPAFLHPVEEKNETLLPAKCPTCGGPVAENAHKVTWMGARTAKCPFCDTVLNL
jgi:hypothetical protein